MLQQISGPVFSSFSLRSTDSRLLSNLISHEKDSTKHLQALLDTAHASNNSLTAYAASSPPPTSQIILAVATSLSNADEALRAYATAVDQWRMCLVGLKEAEEVGSILRDKEILITRLLKASKSTKPSRGSVVLDSSPASIPPFSSSSVLSVRSSEDMSMSYSPSTLFSPTSTTPMNKKLQSAQAELQACEAQ